MTLTAKEGFQIAAWLKEPGPKARLIIRDDIEIPSPAAGEVLVKLEYTGVCHSDVHSIYDETPMQTDIAGHEGVGVVVKLGTHVSDDFLYSRVGIKWLYAPCGTCEICSVKSTSCPTQLNSGRNVRGTFQQFIAAPAKYVTRIPGNLKSELVAPLLCAGITMYSAIEAAKLRRGDWVAITGAGGGLGHLGVQIAASQGFNVVAIDSGPSKRKLSIEMGATEFLDFKENDVEIEIKKLTSGFGVHAVICVAGSVASYQQAPNYLRNLGTLVCVGLPPLDFHLPLSPFQMIVRGLTVVGTSVGTDAEMVELLDMAQRGEVVPRVEVFEFDEINAVIDRLANFEIEGRAVMRIP